MIPIADETEQATKYAFQVKKIADYITSTGIYPYKDIAESAGINEHALRQFISRPMERAKYSLTLHKLYIFIARQLDTSLIKDRDIFVMVSDIKRSRDIIESDSIAVYKRFTDHMDSSFNRINRVCMNYSGTFYVYRYSIVHGKKENGEEASRIVKTRLDIFEDSSVEKMWRFNHFYRDSMGVDRQTTGVVLVTIGTVYCLGKIGRGFGLDVIAFREPIGSQQLITQALVMSVDTRYQPIVSRAVIKHAQDDEEQCFGTFDIEKVETEISEFKQYMDNPSDLDRALTLNLV
jgi:hypothetical protein